MRDRLKVLETVAAEAALHPLLPATARAAIAELVALNRELVERVDLLCQWANVEREAFSHMQGLEKARAKAAAVVLQINSEPGQ